MVLQRHSDVDLGFRAGFGVNCQWLATIIEHGAVTALEDHGVHVWPARVTIAPAACSHHVSQNHAHARSLFLSLRALNALSAPAVGYTAGGSCRALCPMQAQHTGANRRACLLRKRGGGVSTLVARTSAPKQFVLSALWRARRNARSGADLTHAIRDLCRRV